METMTIAVYGSKRQRENLLQLDTLFRSLSERGARLVFHAKLFRHLEELLGKDRIGSWNIYAVTDTDRFSADLAISIGGDGTFLRTAKWVGSKRIPIAGINAGHLGFLTSFSITDVEAFVELLFSGRFRVESRTMLRVSVPENTDFNPEDALNEVVVLKGDSASMVSIDAMLDGSNLAGYLADGLIISTATGSTAYNLSVGGPIIQPRTPAFAITPIAAHTLTMRPLVVADSSVITLTVTSRAETFLLCIDGKYHHLRCGQTLRVEKSPATVRILTPENETFADKIRLKLLWGVR